MPIRRTRKSTAAATLTHLDRAGRARMVDVGDKEVSRREAVAGATLLMRPETLRRIGSGGIAKGEVLAVARIAGIMAAKRTHELIPLCHPLPITSVTIEFAARRGGRLDVSATVIVDGKTGVEMEALTAASTAALTVYDMCKAIDRGMVITDLCLHEKSGGRSGHYRR